MVFARHLRPSLLLIGAVIAASVLVQFAIARPAVTLADPAAKAVGCDFSVTEPDEGSDAYIPGQEPLEEFLILAPRLHGEMQFSTSASQRLADRRGATLVGVVQLLI